jgi:hypothetical protein
MKFKTLETVWKKISYKIEEDLPEIGVYLYGYEGGICIFDYLQDSIDECIKFAFEEFGVPIDSWYEKQSQRF